MPIIKDIYDREMPLLDHLVELRNRLVYSAIAIIVGFLVCYAFADDIYDFLVRPLAQIYESMGYTDRRMIYTGLTEAFFTYVKVAFWAGTFITLLSSNSVSSSKASVPFPRVTLMLLLSSRRIVT